MAGKGRQIYLTQDEIETIAASVEYQISEMQTSIDLFREDLKWAIAYARSPVHQGGIGGTFDDTEVEREQKLEWIRTIVKYIREDRARRDELRRTLSKLWYR